jgi:hypothetical protein
VNGEIQFVAHSGWGADAGTEIWFSPLDNTIYVYGFTYIYAPLSIYYASVISNGTEIRLEGLNYDHVGDFDIPAQIYSLPVTEIGNSAFVGQEGITNVTIPNGVVRIGNSAFEETGITSVVLPNTLLRIGNKAFAVTNLTSIVLPYGIEYIGEFAFALTGITTLDIPSTVTFIGAWAFQFCGMLKEVYINNGVQEIEYGAFADCNISCLTSRQKLL